MQGIHVVSQFLDQLAARQFQSQPAGQSGNQLMVFNPHSWARTDVVAVTVPRIMLGDPERFHWIEAETGKRYPTQTVAANDETLTLAVLAEAVPALGYLSYLGDHDDPQPRLQQTYRWHNRVLENSFYRLAFDQRGIASLYDKQQGRECADLSSPYRIGQYLAVEGQQVASPERMDVQFVANGPLYSEVVLGGQLARHALVQTRVRLYHHAPRIELQIEIERDEARGGERSSIAFPLRGTCGTRSQNWLAWSEARGGVIVASRESSGPNLAVDLSDQALFSYELPQQHSERLRWSYALTSHAGSVADLVAATHFGLSAQLPLLTAWTHEQPSPLTYSFATMEPPGVLILSCQRVGERHLRLQLVETTEHSGLVTLTLRGISARSGLLDSYPVAIEQGTKLRFWLGASEAATLLIEVA